jgi:putative transposase
MVTLFCFLRDCFRTRLVLQAQILALRHQLLVLQRAGHSHRLSLRWADRIMRVWLSQLWNDWRSALPIVKPDTVIAWHRQRFRLYWKWQSRGRLKDSEIEKSLKEVGRQVARFAFLHTSERALQFLRRWEGAPLNPGS